MLVRSFHSKKPSANAEVKRWKESGLDAIIIPGCPSLEKRMRYFVITMEKIDKKDTTEEKPNLPETIEDRLKRTNKAVFG